MIYPNINDLNNGEYNRYEIALATAKCARMITNEYVRQREEADRVNAGGKDSDKPANNLIDREMRDEKAVKIAIGRISRGEYHIVHKDPEEQEREERAILEGMKRNYDDMYDYAGMIYADDRMEEADDLEDATSEEAEESDADVADAADTSDAADEEA